MEKTDKIPLWVFLAFSAIETRKGAMILIWSCLIFTLYCVPWVNLISGSELIETLFLIDDWSWFAMMIPITLWYWLCLRWMDGNTAWSTPENP
ncbi:MAG: hypothetical protein ABW148_05120 [Sedimenticola sp.]